MEQLCSQLATLDQALVYQALLVGAVALSWLGTAIERCGIQAIIAGRTDLPQDVSRIRLAVSALVVGALTFFFCLARELREQTGPASHERAAADRNLLASGLALAAALVRLCDWRAGQDHLK